LQVAVIAPTKHLELAHEGDLYFALAQRAENNTDYKNFYTNMREQKKILLLDNGAFEKGKSISIDRLLDIAKLLKPNEIVAPDFPMHGYESYRMTVDFLSVCPPDYKIVALPHGRDGMEFAYYYSKITKLDKVSVIGLSVLFHKKAGRLRPHVYHYLKKTEQWDKSREHHLFGLDDLAELWCYSSKDIRSVDCSLPISLAYNHIERDYLAPCLNHDRVPEEAELTTWELLRAIANIRTLKEVAGSV